MLFFFQPLFAFGLMMPFLITVSNCSFMAVFAAYANIKKYMIDPYYEEHPEERERDGGRHDEPIFIDQG
jgi:hypothetical protein